MTNHAWYHRVENIKESKEREDIVLREKENQERDEGIQNKDY
jgi:hypothetical protein